MIQTEKDSSFETGKGNRKTNKKNKLKGERENGLAKERVEESERPPRGPKKRTNKRKPREGGRIDRGGRKERVVEGLNSGRRVERETESKRMGEIETLVFILKKGKYIIQPRTEFNLI